MITSPSPSPLSAVATSIKSFRCMRRQTHRVAVSIPLMTTQRPTTSLRDYSAHTAAIIITTIVYYLFFILFVISFRMPYLTCVVMDVGVASLVRRKMVGENEWGETR